MDLIAADESNFSWNDVQQREEQSDEEMEGGELDEGDRKQLPQESFEFDQINDDLADKQFLGGDIPSK